MAEFFEALKISFSDTFGKQIELESGSIMTLNIVLWSLFIGFLLGICGTVYNKVILGSFVRSMLAAEATSKDKALPLGELEHANVFVRFVLRRGSTFRRIVHSVDDSDEVSSRLPLDKARFYIPEENLERARKVYGKLEASVFTVLLSVLALFAATLIALIVVPDLTQMVANFVSGI